MIFRLLATATFAVILTSCSAAPPDTNALAGRAGSDEPYAEAKAAREKLRLSPPSFKGLNLDGPELLAAYPLINYSQYPAELASAMRMADILSDICRGTRTGETETVCAMKDGAMKVIHDGGWCWGGGEIAAEDHWVRCPQSERGDQFGETEQEPETEPPTAAEGDATSEDQANAWAP